MGGNLILPCPHGDHACLPAPELRLPAARPADGNERAPVAVLQIEIREIAVGGPPGRPLLLHPHAFAQRHGIRRVHIAQIAVDAFKHWVGAFKLQIARQQFAEHAGGLVVRGNIERPFEGVKIFIRLGIQPEFRAAVNMLKPHIVPGAVRFL